MTHLDLCTFTVLVCIVTVIPCYKFTETSLGKAFLEELKHAGIFISGK